jgi:hypothetical protein
MHVAYARVRMAPPDYTSAYGSSGTCTKRTQPAGFSPHAENAQRAVLIEPFCRQWSACQPHPHHRRALFCSEKSTHAAGQSVLAFGLFNDLLVLHMIRGPQC